MICIECRRRHHDDCPGGNWCDCQHKPSPPGLVVNAEPALTWVRQG
jgi:hypothetical protein